jgi:hypothetical protein
MDTVEMLQTTTGSRHPNEKSTSYSIAVSSSAMTTLVGFQHADYAVLASDSRTTTTGNWVRTIDDTRKKIHIVGGSLVALAGDDTLCNAWLERLSRVGDIAARPVEALASVWEERERVAATRKTGTEALVANALLALQPAPGPIQLIACDALATLSCHYETMAAVAAIPIVHVLERWLSGDPPINRAIAVAVFTVLESAIYVDAVGGPVQVGILDAAGPRLLEPDLVGAIVTALELAHGDPATALDAASRVHEA